MPTRRINSTRIDSKKLGLLEDAAMALRTVILSSRLAMVGATPETADAIRILNALGLGIEPLKRRAYTLDEIQDLSVGQFFRRPPEKLDCVLNYVITRSARPGVGAVIWGFNTESRRMDHLGDAPSVGVAADACRKVALYPNDGPAAMIRLRQVMDQIVTELRD